MKIFLYLYNPQLRRPYLIVLGLIIAYSAVHIALTPEVETYAVSILALIPVAAAGWLFGLRGGLPIVLFVALPLNFVLVKLAGRAIDELQDYAGTLTLISIGIVVGHVRDLQDRVQRELAERRQAEKVLAKALGQLQEKTAALTKSNQDMETLLHVISHDLKEPLRAIQNFSRLASSHYSQELDDRGKDYLQRIDRAAARLYRLIDDILTLSRVRQMAAPTKMVAGDTIIQDVLERLDAHIKASGAAIHIAPNLPDLHVNQTWATQAIYNLVSNALKYTHDDSPPDITIAPYDGPEGVGLMVQDRGPGVPPEYEERIFQLFQRVANQEVEGEGAGLAIVRQVAERHGGRAWVQPRDGGGSNFIITFGPVIQLPGNSPVPEKLLE